LFFRNAEGSVSLRKSYSIEVASLVKDAVEYGPKNCSPGVLKLRALVVEMIDSHHEVP
jgi:hypothetical protein